MPRVPVVSNVSGRRHGGPDEIRAAMIAQVTSSVRWIDCVESLKAEGASTLLECGPGKVLSGLAKRIDSELTLNSIRTGRLKLGQGCCSPPIGCAVNS